MNLFSKYGIKEVSDVVFYSISNIGDEEINSPILFLDSLKISSFEKTAEKVNAKGGKGNKKLISWSFGKEISLKLQDALFTPASMSLLWGGKLDSKLSPYSSAIVKINMANKYGRLNYSTKAYPSPSLTDEEWEIVFKAATECGLRVGPSDENAKYWEKDYNKDTPYIEQNRAELRKRYLKRQWLTSYRKELVDASPNRLVPQDFIENIYVSPYEEWLNSQQAMPDSVVNKILSYIDELKKIGTIETHIYNTDYVDRMEKCIVKNKEGLIISTHEQKQNLLKRFKNDTASSYVIYYDAKTMLPLLNVTDEGYIQGWDSSSIYEGDYDCNFDGKRDEDEFKLKIGTVYYKWSRTVERVDSSDSVLGRTFVIDSDTFPGVYRIEGETTIREQKTQKDVRYKFTIYRASISSNTNISLSADGEPTVFDMDIEVLSPPNGIQMDLKQFDVEDDVVHGGTRIIPQRAEYTHTNVETIEKKDIQISNNEFY